MKKQLLFSMFAVAFLSSPKHGYAQLTRVSDICSGSCSSNIAYPTLFNSKVYFQATSAAEGVEAWSYDGTNSPVILDDIAAGTSSSIPENFQTFKSNLYFVANSQELWSYDGTNTPSLVQDFGIDYISFCVLQNTMYIIAGTSIWSYTGSGSPSLVANLSPFGITPGLFLGATTAAAYFSATTAASGNEVWYYTGSGTPTVLDVNPGTGSSFNSSTAQAIGSHFYFIADDGTHGSELWTHNGSGSATMVGDINSGSGSGVYGFGGMAAFNGSLYFQADDGTNGSEVWSYDGTNTPSMLANINTASASSSPSWFAGIGSNLYFNATDGSHGYELWKYDGTHTPAMVKDEVAGSGDFNPQWIFGFNSKVYMRADGADGKGAEIWQYDPSFVTAVDQAVPSDTYLIYPNPLAAGVQPQINTSQALDHVRVLNAQGHVLYEGTSLKALPAPGIYFIEWQQDDKRSVQRVVVQ